MFWNVTAIRRETSIFISKIGIALELLSFRILLYLYKFSFIRYTPLLYSVIANTRLPDLVHSACSGQFKAHIFIAGIVPYLLFQTASLQSVQIRIILYLFYISEIFFTALYIHLTNFCITKRELTPFAESCVAS